MVDAFIERWWKKLTTKYSPSATLYGGVALTHLAVFWGVGGMFLLVDIYKPKALYKYKIQKDMEVTKEEIIDCVKRCLKNQIVWLILPMLFAYNSKYFGDKFARKQLTRPLPGWKTIVWQVLFTYLCEEIFFYSTHRLFHIYPFLYKNVHKYHHTFKAPIAIAAVYAKSPEMLISNILPGAVGPAILQSHIIVEYIWFILGQLMTLHHHSGYDFPYMIGHLNPRMHDDHHKYFNVNFGVFGLMDDLFGTMRKPESDSNDTKNANNKLKEL
eukprot:c53413_g1_i1.p1 GENE.c53413_g1_i1~~c53413_g1_i1.p1  ORF type:complete len:270 (-),score=3.49 c53413_g1_i1:28-837(-)